MKIEITDSLFEEYCQLIKERYFSENVGEHIEHLIKSELYKFCVSGYELDALTGTKTRYQLEQDINCALWGESGNDLSIFRNRYLCLDIDNFKKYIDFHGLTAGDQMLVEIAQQLRQKYPNANIYRFGGDEFVVELGPLPFIPLKIHDDVTIKYSIVDIAVERNARRHHSHRVIMFNLDKGIVEASEQVMNIKCEFSNRS